MNHNVKQDLDNLARAQQMKINARLTALQCAQSLMQLSTYNVSPDHITLLAMAGDIEKYILGEIEEESKEALAQAKSMQNVRPIVRP